MKNKELIADNSNIRILQLLQNDPRIALSEVARQVGLSNPAVKERITRMEQSGIINGYRLNVNPTELGYPLMAFVRVRPLPGHLPQIAALAQKIPEIAECHRITGDDCFILRLYLRDIGSLDEVLDRFLVHGQTTTSIVQSSPVPHRPVPLPEPSNPKRRGKQGAVRDTIK